MVDSGTNKSPKKRAAKKSAPAAESHHDDEAPKVAKRARLAPSKEKVESHVEPVPVKSRARKSPAKKATKPAPKKTKAPSAKKGIIRTLLRMHSISGKAVAKKAPKEANSDPIVEATDSKDPPKKRARGGKSK